MEEVSSSSESKSPVKRSQTDVFGRNSRIYEGIQRRIRRPNDDADESSDSDEEEKEESSTPLQK